MVLGARALGVAGSLSGLDSRILRSALLKVRRNPYKYMKTNLVDRAEAKAVSARNGTKTSLNRPILLLLLLLLSVVIGAGGCTDYYASPPVYGPGYAVAPGYAYPGSVTVEVGDRPY